MSAAPDYAAPLVGWRAWAGVDEEDGEEVVVRLRSVVFETRWPPRERLDAVCAQRIPWWPLARLLRIEPHAAPDEGCECGIYAARTPDLPLAYLDRRAFGAWTICTVVGRVALWGRVIECARGWRGTHAYPTHLYLVGPALDRRHGPDARALAGQLAVYGVPVDVLEARTMPGLLEELAGREGAPSGAPP